jgi:CRP-like cAMP-binding protein
VIVTLDSRLLGAADRIVGLADGRVTSNVVVTESVLSALFLSKCPMLAGLTPDALTRVADRLVLEKHPTGAVIYRRGDSGDKFYLIRRGAVEVVTERTGARLREGDYFGEGALVTDEPRNATAVAREEVETYTLTREHFREALAASVSLKEELLKTYLQRR